MRVKWLFFVQDRVLAEAYLTVIQMKSGPLLSVTCDPSGSMKDAYVPQDTAQIIITIIVCVMFAQIFQILFEYLHDSKLFWVSSRVSSRVF